MSIANRYDFYLLFDVEYGNPNGDPDAGNLPRIDPESMHGLVSDVSLKRKVRDYVSMRWGGDEESGMGIYVKHHGVLNAEHRKAYEKLGITPITEAVDESGDGSGAKGKKQSRNDVAAARTEMCRRYYDVRTFGGVMSTGINAGQVRGPVQMTFGRSIEPIVPMDISLTRVAVTSERDAVPEDKPGTAGQKETEMGRRSLVPYGLYQAYGFVSPHFAVGTGFSDLDLAALWEALCRMFEGERTSTKGLMSTRDLIVFKHPNALGVAPSHDLFARIHVDRTDDATTPARAFTEYEVKVDESGLSERGIEVIRPLEAAWTTAT